MNGQTKTVEISTFQNRQQSIALVQGLIACDVIKEDNKMLTGTLKQTFLKVDVLLDEAKDCVREIQKRDYVISRNEKEFEMMSELNDDIKKALLNEKRKKPLNKIVYFGLGALAGYGGYKLLK